MTAPLPVSRVFLSTPNVDRVQAELLVALRRRGYAVSPQPAQAIRSVMITVHGEYANDDFFATMWGTRAELERLNAIAVDILEENVIYGIHQRLAADANQRVLAARRRPAPKIPTGRLVRLAPPPAPRVVVAPSTLVVGGQDVPTGQTPMPVTGMAGPVITGPEIVHSNVAVIVPAAVTIVPAVVPTALPTTPWPTVAPPVAVAAVMPAIKL